MKSAFQYIWVSGNMALMLPMLRYINNAIRQSQTDGEVPQKNWLLSQAALEWKLGDLASAARSLEKSMEIDPGTTYEHTLVAFNERVQEVWEPTVNERSLAQFYTISSR